MPLSLCAKGIDNYVRIILQWHLIESGMDNSVTEDEIVGI